MRSQNQNFRILSIFSQGRAGGRATHLLYIYLGDALRACLFCGCPAHRHGTVGAALPRVVDTKMHFLLLSPSFSFLPYFSSLLPSFFFFHFFFSSSSSPPHPRSFMQVVAGITVSPNVIFEIPINFRPAYNASQAFHFVNILAIRIILDVHFLQFSQFLPNFIIFRQNGHRTTLGHFCKFGLFWPFWPFGSFWLILAHLATLGTPAPFLKTFWIVSGSEFYRNFSVGVPRIGDQNSDKNPTRLQFRQQAKKLKKCEKCRNLHKLAKSAKMSQNEPNVPK